MASGQKIVTTILKLIEIKLKLAFLIVVQPFHCDGGTVRGLNPIKKLTQHFFSIETDCRFLSYSLVVKNCLFNRLEL